MAQVHFHVDGSDETFTLEVDPPPQIGAQFGTEQRWFEVLSLSVPDPDSTGQVEATLLPIDRPANQG